MAIINGRRVTNLPAGGAYGAQLISEMDLEPGRRPVLMKPGGMETIDAGKRYGERDVTDSKGQPVKVSDIPDRTKGASTNELFAGRRSERSRTIITEQVIDVAENLFNDERGVDFDEDEADWLVIPEFRLPKNWHRIARTTPLLIVFPTGYPEIPPVGCYLIDDIPQAPNGHFYKDAYHSAASEPIEKGWKWYCVYVEQKNWKPAAVRRSGDWKRGDNLWTYMTLINEVLASAD